MSNKGLTFLIIILLLLCGATFGAFYLKIHPELKPKIIIEPKRDFIFIGFMIHSNLITKEGQIRVPLATLPRDYIKA